jgi:hypothetical protein
VKKINLEYSDIKVNLPNIDYFNEKISNGEKFHFMRANHSFMDSFHHTYQYYENLERDIINKDYHKIAGHIVHAWKDKKWGLKFWHGESDKRREYIANLTKMIFEYDSLPNSVHIGLSLGVGLGLYWGIWDASHPVQFSRNKFAYLADKFVNKPFYYAGVVKHYTIMNEWPSMFNLLNNMDFQVVFLGPTWFSDFKDVFGIQDFKFVEIPRRGAMEKIDEYINQVKEIDTTSEKPTILFYMTGHILSAKITKELINTNIYSMDVGRSFDILIKEKFKDGDLAEKCWTYLPMNELTNYVNNTRNG